jgi:acetoin utilization protein AcuB
MLVGERMAHPVVIAYPDWLVITALNQMLQKDIHRLPVLDKQGNLVGIVSESDLLRASPAGAANLSVLEKTYIFNKLTVASVMTRKVLTVNVNASIEEAARLMVDNKIGGLPVVKENPQKVVGIITETDVFKLFLDLFGAREEGIRVTAIVPDVPGELVQLTKAIFDAGGNIIALGTLQGKSIETREVTIKVTGIETQILRDALQPIIERIVDIRVCHVE